MEKERSRYVANIVSLVSCAVIAVVYLVVLAKLVIFKDGFRFMYRSVNLLPFDFIRSGLRDGVSISVVLKNVLGNIGVFIPFGMLLPVFLKKLDWKKTALAGLLTSVLIEAVQLIFGIGITDIDDVLLNTIGVAIGAVVYFLLLKRLDDRWHNHFGTVLVVDIVGAFCAFLLFYFGYGNYIAETPHYEVNSELVKDFDIENPTYNLKITNVDSIVENKLDGISYTYEEENDKELEEKKSLELAADTKYITGTISAEYTPNGNVKSTTVTYGTLTQQEFAEYMKEQAKEGDRWLDAWSEDGTTVDAVEIILYED